MNMLQVFQQPDRAQRMQLIFLVAQNHQGERLILCPPTLPNIIFMIGDDHAVLHAIREVLPDLLLLDTRLPEAIKWTFAHHLKHLHRGSRRRSPLVANVALERWQQANREVAYGQKHRKSPWDLESLLVTAVMRSSKQTAAPSANAQSDAASPHELEADL